MAQITVTLTDAAIEHIIFALQTSEKANESKHDAKMSDDIERYLGRELKEQMRR